MALALLLSTGGTAVAQVSVGISTPSVDIGVNMPVYPELVRVPDFPVYYAPGAQTNYFFYDGNYWVYERDNWHTSAWYNGPWTVVGREAVPLYVLRVPVSYYRNPPLYFRGWAADAPPRWGDYWGPTWARQRVGWDRWDRRAVPAPAPLPLYQREYFGARYPLVVQQRELLVRNYRYQPREGIVRQHQAALGRAAEQPARAAPRAQAQPQRPQHEVRTAPQHEAQQRRAQQPEKQPRATEQPGQPPRAPKVAPPHAEPREKAPHAAPRAAASAAHEGRQGKNRP
jgi:hypothetical protein